MFFYALVSFIYWFFLCIYLLVNGRKIKYLVAINRLIPDNPASLVVVVAVRNEEKDLKEALLSICNLDYPNYKILVINDRSTDNSSVILQEMQQVYPQISIINIATLPPGWLGKNHALYTGYLHTQEEYILFTDADVIFDHSALTRAMSYVKEFNLDHLTVLPGILSASSFFKSILSTFVIILTAFQRPWAAKKQSSKASMGVGAFNLVKRSAYVRAGTHKAFAMRPDDDLKLASYLKRSGSRSDVLYGNGLVDLEWYRNINEFIAGLMKNTFSGFNYNTGLLLLAVTGMLVGYVLPLPLVLIFGNDSSRLFIVGMLLSQLILYANMPGTNGRWWYGFMCIYGSAIMVFILVRSAIVTLYHGGIYWRGTFYSLSDLKGEHASL